MISQPCRLRSLEKCLGVPQSQEPSESRDSWSLSICCVGEAGEPLAQLMPSPCSWEERRVGQAWSTLRAPRRRAPLPEPVHWDAAAALILLSGSWFEDPFQVVHSASVNQSLVF